MGNKRSKAQIEATKRMIAARKEAVAKIQRKNRERSKVFHRKKQKNRVIVLSDD